MALSVPAMVLLLLVTTARVFCHTCSSNTIDSSYYFKLAAAYPQAVFFSGSTIYDNHIIENWSKTCVETPTCLFEPATVVELAGGLAILRKTQTQFAVRGGGHMSVPGAASISKGVLISMVNFDTMGLGATNATVKLGAGLRWGAIYDWLSPQGLATAGGRFGPVGVPGYLLGGGINYFGSQYGWSANTVLRYQVVLANSTIVTASATSHPDLFWALKGRVPSGQSDYHFLSCTD